MWRGWMVISAVVGPLLAGCAAPTSAAGEPAGPQPNSAAPATADPLALIGSWTVTEAAEEPGAILRLGTGELSLFRACGYVMGNWRATTDGLFVGHTFGGDCGSDAGPLATPAWLRRAFGFRQDGDTQLLLDKQGETVARLLSGAQPTPGPNLAPQEAAPPVVDEAARRLLAPASPLPANFRPSVGSDLLGRWIPADRPANAVAKTWRGGRTAKERPFAEFGSDGEWRGSDGCNGGFGRWMSGPAGSLLTTSGPSTLMLCDGVPVPSWLAQTYRAGFDGDVLVLVNQTGRELGRLQRG